MSRGLPAESLLRPPEEGARRVALELLAEAAADLERVGDLEDAEALHDFRVNVRRLRSWVRAFRRHLGPEVADAAQLALSRLGSGTNAARDFEVQIEWLEEHKGELGETEREAVAWLVEQLAARKRAAYRHVLDGVPERFAEIRGHMQREFGAYRAEVHPGDATTLPTFGREAAERIEEHAEAMHQALEAVESEESAPSLESAHRARIVGKRLRYLLEPLLASVDGTRGAIKRLKSLQNLLGELNDLRVLTATLGQALEQQAIARARRLMQAVERGRWETREELARTDLEVGLVGLAARVRDRRRELFAELQERWRGARSEAFFERIGAVVQRLRGPSGAGNLEIERKYLLTRLPSEAQDAPWLDIEQGWLPGREVRERLRAARGPVDERFYRTVKLGEGLTRQEFEETIPAELFARLWPLTVGCRVRKRRYQVREDDRVWEIDVFQDRELVLAEVELPSPDTVVVLPGWLEPWVAREVTGDPAFSNLALAR